MSEEPKLRVFEVIVTFKGYVIAESEGNAIDIGSYDIVNDQCGIEEDVYECTRREDVDWDDEDLLYGGPEDPISVGEFFNPPEPSPAPFVDTNTLDLFSWGSNEETDE